MLKQNENRSSDEVVPSPELRLFIREMFGPDKVAETLTKVPHTVKVWTPDHNNEEPPF